MRRLKWENLNNNDEDDNDNGRQRTKTIGKGRIGWTKDWSCNLIRRKALGPLLECVKTADAKEGGGGATRHKNTIHFTISPRKCIRHILEWKICKKESV